MSSKVKFGSKIGLIAASVGSAVGLGNVWRFPAEVQSNGGAAFLLVYIGCVFLLGIPVMLAEFSLGRGGASDAIGSFKNVGARKAWWGVGGIAIIASYLILCFYMVVAGWTLQYLIQSVSGQLYAPVEGVGGLNQTFSAHMKEFIEQPWPPLWSTYLMLAMNLGILLMGVQKGIERLSNILMPLLFVLLVVFCCEALSLPKAKEGLEFFFRPDFSKINGRVMMSALGQAFFSLSLGMGVLITYSSYFPQDTKLPKTAFTVSALDLLVAVMVGIVIFPAVTSFGLTGEDMRGATLVFVTLPEVFTMMPGTRIWSVLFFLLLLVAALTSTISIAEVSIRCLQDRFNMSRLSACCVCILPLIALCTLSSLSNGVLSDFRILGYTIFDGLDRFATNILLPLGSLLLCLWYGWAAPKGFLRRELTNNGILPQGLMVQAVEMLIKFAAPVLILCVLVSGLLN